MGKSLVECGHRQRRLPGTEWLYGSANKEFDEVNAYLHSVADKVSKLHKVPSHLLSREYPVTQNYFISDRAGSNRE